jgi:hypothetical protein
MNGHLGRGGDAQVTQRLPETAQKPTAARTSTHFVEANLNEGAQVFHEIQNAQD